MISMNILNRDIMSCLPLLASVLGNRYGVEIRIGGDRAMTDGKVIYLPSLPSDLDSDTLDAARGYLDHEAAHIRHTDFNLLKASRLDKTTNWLFNAIEDWRVENRLAEIFPGCKGNFQRLITKIFVDEAMTEAREKSLASVILSHVLLTVRAWDVPAVRIERDKARARIESADKGLAEKLDAILDEVRGNCPDTRASIDYARRLAACIRQWMSEQEEIQPQKSGDADKSDSSENVRNEQNKHGKENSPDGREADSQLPKAKGVIDSRSENFCDSDASPDSGANSEEGKGQSGDGVKPSLDDFFDSVAGELSEGFGESLEQKLEGKKTDREDDGLNVAVEGDKLCQPLSLKEKSEAMLACNAMRQRLAGLLQAKTLRQSGPGRKGRLSAASLYRLSIGNPKIFRAETEQEGIETALHILLDCSYSMEKRQMKLACQACYAVAKALFQMRGVNPAVTAFPAACGGESVYPLARHGGRISDNFALEPLGGTPLASAIWWAMCNMLTLKERRKVMLVITDGVPDSVKAAETAISKASQVGMEVYGIGIISRAISLLLPDTSRVINDLDDLAPAMFGLLQNALLKGGCP